MSAPGRRLDLGLQAFAGSELDAAAFLDQVCSQRTDVGALEPAHDDLAPLQKDLAAASEHLEQMESAVALRIRALTQENERKCAALSELVRVQQRAHESAAKQFRQLERRFGRASDGAVQLGSRLQHLGAVRDRALRGRRLLTYLSEFAAVAEPAHHQGDGAEGGGAGGGAGARAASLSAVQGAIDVPVGGVFADLPRSLCDAAPVARDLEVVTAGMLAPMLAAAAARIERASGRMLQGLLDEFDRASAEGDQARMRALADAVLDCYEHKSGPESLFARFIFNSLNPLVAARQRSAAFRPEALKDSLGHLFSQIRATVRTTHGVVLNVFPRHANELLALLVSRLFHDAVFGLQPMLSEFLTPPNRVLAHSEYLQILQVAYRETEALVLDLGRGLAGTSAGAGPGTGSKPGAGRNVGAGATRVEVTKPEEEPNESQSQLSSNQQLHSSALRRQMVSVFQPFLEGLQAREIAFFDQRVSKRLYGTLPHDIVELACPDLEVPPEVRAQQQQQQQQQQHLLQQQQQQPPQQRDHVAPGQAQQQQLHHSGGAEPRSASGGESLVPGGKDGALATSSSVASGALKAAKASRARLEALYRVDAVQATRELLAARAEEVSSASLMYRALQLRSSWREDMELSSPAALYQWQQQNRGLRWRLEYVDSMLEDEPEPASETAGGGGQAVVSGGGQPRQAARATEEIASMERPDDAAAGSGVINAASFFTVYYELRGLPGQLVRWAFEGHARLMDLLASSKSNSGPLPPVLAQAEVDEETAARRASFVLSGGDDNRAALEAVAELFQRFCDRFFLGLLLPVVHVLAAGVPAVDSASLRAVDAPLATAAAARAVADDLEAFECDLGPLPAPSQQYAPAVLMLVPVLGLGGDGTLRPHALPALATGNAAVKALASSIAQLAAQTQRGGEFGEALVPRDALGLLVAASHAVEDCCEQALLYWRDVVFPTLSDAPNHSSACLAYLQRRLAVPEAALAAALRAALQHARLLLTACAAALWDKADYDPPQGKAVAYDAASQWARVAAQVVAGFLAPLCRLGNAEARAVTLTALALAARDVLLGQLKRAKVSLAGSFTLVQDIAMVSQVALGNEVCAAIPQVREAWAELKLLAQLFIVQPDHLRGLLLDEKDSSQLQEGLHKVKRRLICEALSHRADFKAQSKGQPAPWVKALFAKPQLVSATARQHN
jgi:hypothetical protein